MRQAQEEAHLLEELTQHIGWGVLAERMKNRMASTKFGVLNGNVANFEAYKTRTGWLTGVHEVLGEPEEAYKQVQSELKRRAENGPDAA